MLGTTVALHTAMSFCKYVARRPDLSPSSRTGTPNDDHMLLVPLAGSDLPSSYDDTSAIEIRRRMGPPKLRGKMQNPAVQSDPGAGEHTGTVTSDFLRFWYVSEALQNPSYVARIPHKLTHLRQCVTDMAYVTTLNRTKHNNSKGGHTQFCSSS
jgi:hypothetical protein